MYESCKLLESTRRVRVVVVELRCGFFNAKREDYSMQTLTNNHTHPPSLRICSSLSKECHNEVFPPPSTFTSSQSTQLRRSEYPSLFPLPLLPFRLHERHFSPRYIPPMLLKVSYSIPRRLSIKALDRH